MPPAPPKVVDSGTYAVLAADVSVIYKTDMPAVPPAEPASYLLRVILKGIGKPPSPTLSFSHQGERDEFYERLVEAMGQ